MAISYKRNRKHVFVDWSGIEAGYGVAWNHEKDIGNKPQPKLMPTGLKIVTFAPEIEPEPVITREHRWEAEFINAYSTVFEDDGVFKLYYEAYSSYSGDYSARVCYAQSQDGVSWEKPVLGLCEFEGSKENNIVFQEGMGLGKGPHGAFVFRDPNGDDHDRYKLVYCSDDFGKAFVAGAVSPDGLRWAGLDKPVIRNQKADTETVILWDDERECYMGYFRDWPTGNINQGRRVILHAKTQNFYEWPERSLVFAADSQDDPGTDVYTNSYTPWPGAQDAHLMFPCFYPRTRDTMETHMVVSRDGVLWHRPQRESIWGYGAPGSYWVAGSMAGQGIITPRPGLWFMFLGCRTKTHNQTHYGKIADDINGLWRANIREDGLMAMEAEGRGECWSSPITFEGPALKINGWTHFGGSIKIGLCDESGEPIEGMAIDDCDEMTGDNMWSTVIWNGKSDLSQWEGSSVRLHIEITRGRLHAWRFGDE